jgi:CBS domain containing-hemolysin-like protein
MNAALALGFVFLLFVIVIASYVDRLYAEMGKFLSREFQENIEWFETRVEPRLGVGRERAALSMSVVKHTATSVVAMVVGYYFFHAAGVTPAEVVQAGVILLLTIIICQHLLPFIFFSRTEGAWLAWFAPLLRGLIYLALPVTLALGFLLSVVSLSKDSAEPEPEHPSEAVDALIEAGQEEGILEESDRELIQSVVEFGDKTVREVMTPRPAIFAVPVETTIEQLTEMLRTRPFSRVPVYAGKLDEIVGIVFAHDVLQVADVEARTRTVKDLMRPEPQFVPETRQVSEQLREMQATNNHMAIVVDEYGGVAGVVTIEDMLEEIVGEIHDEHEHEVDCVREGEHAYVVSGSLDLDRLDDLFAVRLNPQEAMTAGGLVTTLLGRIPRAGEVIEHEGLRFEVLKSTERRVERLRVSLPPSLEKRQSA